MRYRITGLSLDPSVVEDERRLCDALARVFDVALPEIRSPVVIRHSLDARRRPARHIYSIELDIPDAVTPRPRPPRGSSVKLVEADVAPAALRAPPVFAHRTAITRLPPGFRPVVVGAGPAGLFGALALARLGAPPLVLERGRPVAERVRSVEGFWSGGALDPESNVVFGEGGACTFSDGKIYTRSRNPQIAAVLRELVELGAPHRILVDARPHIGSDRLRAILTAFRARLEDLGVEFRFGARVTGLAREGDRIVGLRLEGGEELRRAPVLLAAGHSARDTFAFLRDAGVLMEAWSTAIGLRVEHPQALIDRVQYKTSHPRAAGLPPADYHLAYHGTEGRGAYSFCMCPGGRIVAATNLPGRIVTNGMSLSDRRGDFANSGLVVQVRPEDYRGHGPEDDALRGFAFQDHWETRAFELGGGEHHAPAQRVEDFIEARPTIVDVASTYAPGVRPADLRACLPPQVVEQIAQALVSFGRRMRGFDGPDAVLVGVETRTSSPVRLLRDDDCRSLGLKGLYPVGEGAGYAGGIVSAAVDGIKAAEAMVEHARVRVAR